MTDRAPEADTVSGIAEALRADPVVVHESMGNGRTEEVHDGLVALVDDLADAGVPAYVALVQTPNVELATRDSSDDLLRLIHADLDRPGLYVVSTPDGQPAVATYGVPLDATDLSLARYDAVPAVREDLPEGEFLAAAGEAAILLSAAAKEDATLTPGEAEDLVTSGPWIAAYGEEPLPYELEDAQGEPLTPVVVAVTCGLTAVVVGWRLLRARAALAAGPQEQQDTKTKKQGQQKKQPRPRVARADQTAVQAPASVSALREEVDRSIELVPDEVYGCLEAAEDLVGSRSRLEVVASLVLAEQGTARLRGEPLPVRCYFDPRHGASARTTTVSGVSVPACAACAAAVAAGREPDSLSVDGGRQPYWKGDSVWAETGLGSIDPDLWRRLAERTR
ncbi:hypothetical protein [Nocardioides dongkuii]|uniref:hypothetical protein n=1 Tax=Nocardioides dongkuii TaxID=2760089 RepID=UPI0015FB05A7|nr:hypothetical protein [Nocardioides dongkuii]